MWPILVDRYRDYLLQNHVAHLGGSILAISRLHKVTSLRFLLNIFADEINIQNSLNPCCGEKYPIQPKPIFVEVS